MIIPLTLTLFISFTTVPIARSDALSAQEPSQSKSQFESPEPEICISRDLSSLLSKCISTASIECLLEYDASASRNDFFVNQNEGDEDESEAEIEESEEVDGDYDDDQDDDEDNEDDEDGQEGEEDETDEADGDDEDDWDNEDD